jgi:hypothetical protein
MEPISTRAKKIRSSLLIIVSNSKVCFLIQKVCVTIGTERFHIQLYTVKKQWLIDVPSAPFK